jgi:uncharacterized protein YgbK (DUF1537 family)
MRIYKKTLFEQLPAEWPEDILPDIQEELKRSRKKIVILDDDPTGTQTVSNVTVLTGWGVNALVKVFEEPEAIVYLLTNSRSLPLDEAQSLNREIAHNLIAASRISGRDFSVVSRSDSTLRGHFPGEVEALLSEMGQQVDGILIIPFFEEGGRYTINDIHYVAEEDMLVPAGETEYARDATFGYSNSDLRAWVSEKYEQRVKDDEIASISLDTIRRDGVTGVERALSNLTNQKLCVVNSASYRDMEVFVAGLLKAEANGKRFICRTAASFVRVRGGMRPRTLLSAAELGTISRKKGGLIVAGSYIQKSTRQIEVALSLPGIHGVEVSVQRVLNPQMRIDEIQRVVAEAEGALKVGNDALIFTSRQLVFGSDAANSLEIGQVVSNSLVEIVCAIQERPAWIIAKGGITSSDIATKALRVYTARVMGQILPGVPVWRTEEGSRWPGLVYVVFPGNVGGVEAIAEVVIRLRGKKRLVEKGIPN